MKNNKKIYDAVVIGGGPAGIMAALSAAGSGKRVVLVEKNNRLGEKLILTGNGRCNITNAEFNLRDLVNNFYNGEFLFHVFSIFGPKNTIDFFKKIGVDTKIENNKKVFPKGNDSRKVLEALEKSLKNSDVEIIFNNPVVDFEIKEKKITKIILKNGMLESQKYILCTGGNSYQKTGSDGFGYKLAEKMGHSITKVKPALIQIPLKEDWVWKLQGISLKNMKIMVWQNNKKQCFENGEIMFTNSGISGPAALNISSNIVDLLDKGEVKIVLDMFPEMNHEEVLDNLIDILKRYPNKSIKNILNILMPERVAESMLNVLNIDKDKISNNISNKEKELISVILKNFSFFVDRIIEFDNAMVTHGGIDLKFINHKNMKSKIINNLYFAGEIIDVDGKTGGFNLQMCWSTGYLAGKTLVD